MGHSVKMEKNSRIYRSLRSLIEKTETLLENLLVEGFGNIRKSRMIQIQNMAEECRQYGFAHAGILLENMADILTQNQQKQTHDLRPLNHSYFFLCHYTETVKNRLDIWNLSESKEHHLKE